MHRALKPGGVVCTQGESQWYHLEIIKSLAAMCKQVFTGGSVQYAYTTIPTYPRCGAWLASGRREGREVPGEADGRKLQPYGRPCVMACPQPCYTQGPPIVGPTPAALHPSPPPWPRSSLNHLSSTRCSFPSPLRALAVARLGS